MKRIRYAFLLLVAILIGALTIAACSTGGASVAPAAASTPTSSSQPQATAVSEASPTPRAAATTQATSTSAPIAAATRTSAPTGPITVATVATSADASGNAAGVFATAIRVSPTQPVSGPDYVTFYVTFNNTSGKSQALKWHIKIWSPASSTQSFGETAKQINDIPAGTSEVASAANWRTNSLNCEPFTARVYWLNSDVNFGNPNEFKKPDGSPGPQLNFQVCPATPKP